MPPNPSKLSLLTACTQKLYVKAHTHHLECMCRQLTIEEREGEYVQNIGGAYGPVVGRCYRHGVPSGSRVGLLMGSVKCFKGYVPCTEFQVLVAVSPLLSFLLLPCPSHLAMLIPSIFWVEWKKDGLLGMCLTQLEKLGTHSLYSPFPHGRNCLLKGVYLGTRSGPWGWGDACNCSSHSLECIYSQIFSPTVCCYLFHSGKYIVIHRWLSKSVHDAEIMVGNSDFTIVLMTLLSMDLYNPYQVHQESLNKWKQ